MLFKLNNVSNILDVYLHIEYIAVNAGGKTEQIEKCCSFRILQPSFFIEFFKGIVACIKENQCNISVKNSTPSIVGGAGQYYSKAEIDEKISSLNSLIRAISTLPDPPGTEVIVNNNSSLVLDINQMKAIVALLIAKGV